MKIKLADLNTAISQILQKIRAGVRDARDQGIIAELPGKVDFQVEVIIDYQALQEAETSTQTSNQTTIGAKPAIVTTTVRAGGGQTVTEAQTSQQEQSQSVGTTDVGETTYTY